MGRITAVLFFAMLFPVYSHGQNKDTTEIIPKKRNIILRFDDWLQKFDAKEEEARPTAMFINPAVSFSPANSLGLGAYFVIKVDNSKMRAPKWARFNTNDSFFDAQILYTLKNQFSVKASPNWFFINNRLNLSGTVGYTNSSAFFWGLGNDTEDGGRDKYLFQRYLVDLTAKWEFYPRFFAGIGYTFKHYTVSSYAEGGTIDSGGYPGKGKTFISGVGLLADYDTRDDIYAARKGYYFSVRGDIFPQKMGSTYAFSSLTIDLRSYFTFAVNHTLNAQVFMKEVYGDVPFMESPNIGNALYARGIFEGRYMDRAAVSTQLEYRYYFGRFAAAAFGGAGNVGENIGQAWSVDKWNAGAGIRFRLFKKSRLYMRLDFTTGPEGRVYTYFTINELF